MQEQLDNNDILMYSTHNEGKSVIAERFMKTKDKRQKTSTLKTKVNNLERKVPDTTTLIHINQYNTDKQKLDKKNQRC